MPSISSLPRLGLVPATTWVPYALLRRPWYSPWLVGLMPWITTLVVSSTKMLTFCPLSPDASWWLGLRVRQRDGAPGGVEHGGLRDERIGKVVDQQRATRVGVGAVEAHDDRGAELDPAHGLDDPLGHLVDPGDAAEDVDEDGLHRRIGV